MYSSQALHITPAGSSPDAEARDNLAGHLLQHEVPLIHENIDRGKRRLSSTISIRRGCLIGQIVYIKSPQHVVEELSSVRSLPSHERWQSTPPMAWKRSH